MSGTVLVIRPEPGLSATMAAAKELGLNAIGYPLFEIRAVAWECPNPHAFDALLIGSANAVRHGGATLEKLKDKPVHVVGESTGKAARDAGFQVASVGSGGLQNVLDQIETPARLLRVAGADHVPLTVPDGITMHTEIAYEAVPLDMPEALRTLHDLDLVVLLHSAAAAEQFDRESRRLTLNRKSISVLAIGPRVASAAGEGWKAIHVSPRPNDHAMLEMAKDVCI